MLSLLTRFSIAAGTFLLMHAAQAQFNLSPRGLRTGLLGSNGIALSSDTSAGVLNPASIAGLKGSRFSAASSVAQLTRLKFAESSQLVDRNQEAQFGLTSGYIANFFNFGNLSLGFYAVEEANLKFDKYFEYRFQGTGNAVGSSQLKISTVTNRVGFLVGGPATETFIGNLNWGLTPFLYLHDSQNLQSGKIQSGASVEVNFNNIEREYSVFGMRLGFLLTNDLLNFGAYVQPEGRLLGQHQTRYTGRVSSLGDIEDFSNSNPSDETSPLQWGVGLKWNNFLGGSIVFDYSTWASVEYTDSSFVEDQDQVEATDRAERLGVGYSFNIDQHSAFGGGIQHTELTDPKDGSRYKLSYFSLGREQKINFLNTYFNLFFSEYNSNSDDGSQLTNFGISIGTEYSY